ncbi:MAG: class I SAM-dependent methyltransferase [Chloroflexi bacterium]|jgi:16S rRNA (guanine1516-N2)-methyltransferase|nr:class I SAM-dependent methyltransferase [Chloroflexota bacterium]MBT4072920.1 class I SAM-dependent methyltransferase [Chloroflexota bacterium]MBT6681855.1 class I SAM-dependent methyltransferase [Chloroflexota bacterium]
MSNRLPDTMRDDPRLIVTTSRYASNATRALAKQKAEDWGFRYVGRSDVSFARVLEHAEGDAVAAFVFGDDGLVLSTGQTQLRHGIGTAAIRLLSIGKGTGDPLIRAGELRTGDRVFDATLGLGRDALVAARAVGPGGEVIGVESNHALFVLTREGLASYDAGAESATIQLLHDDSRRLLSSAAAGSYDVVVVDPMFSKPAKSDGNFEALRDFADSTNLDPAWVRHARRVAKRWVLVKAAYGAPWFGDEGLQRVPGMGASRWWRAKGRL